MALHPLLAVETLRKNLAPILGLPPFDVLRPSTLSSVCAGPDPDDHVEKVHDSNLEDEARFGHEHVCQTRCYDNIINQPGFALTSFISSFIENEAMT